MRVVNYISGVKHKKSDVSFDLSHKKIAAYFNLVGRVSQNWLGASTIFSKGENKIKIIFLSRILIRYAFSTNYLKYNIFYIIIIIIIIIYFI